MMKKTGFGTKGEKTGMGQKITRERKEDENL